MNLSSPVSELSGVGEKRTECYKKLGIISIRDLLYHFPRSYVDFTDPVPVLLAETDRFAAVKGCIVKKLRDAPIRRGLTIYKALANDGGEDFNVVFYNNKFAFAALQEGWEYIFYGRVTGSLAKREIISPQAIPADAECRLRAVYPLTEGITSAGILTNMKQALELADDIADPMPVELLDEYRLCGLSRAVCNIHFPSSLADAEEAKKRLIFDELLTLQLGMLLLKGRNRNHIAERMTKKDMTEFTNVLPFELTGAQKRAIREITEDMCGEVPMNRLVQGDVGSGKTAVAAAACLFAARNGCQSALMAPTEILTRQHFKTLSELLTPLGIRVCCLTGSLTPKQKSLIKEEIASGGYDVIVGTHALVSDTTVFRSLSLVITDEQHRFGVNQRATLADKGKNPHKLVMSATPIPRTLALIIYGDLDISILDELPKGRVPIQTFAVTGRLRTRAYGFIKKQLDAGRQGYIVCPMVDDNPDCDATAELIAAKEYAARLSDGEFKEYSVGLLHGKLPSAEKERVMAEFKQGSIRLLVSTTVVEVGVDVPNATIMVIENADRFGLSQLHQLRGRVGRSSYESYCVLITDNVNDDIRARLSIMTKTTDGFKISEEDLRLRGSGDFFGSRQHGLPPLKIADMATDSETLYSAQQLAQRIMNEDRDMKKYPLIWAKANEMFSRSGENAFN